MRVMKCPNCGTEVAENSKFCNECGSSFVVKEPDIAIYHKKKKPVIIIGISVALGVVFVVFAVLFGIKLAKQQDAIQSQDNCFLVNAYEFKSRFNQQLTGGLAGIKDYEIIEAYGFRFYDATLQPDVSVSIIADPETDLIHSVSIKLDMTKKPSSDTFSSYILYLFKAFNPSATNQDNTDYLDVVTDLKKELTGYSSGFYRYNEAAYILTAEDDEMYIMVIPHKTEASEANQSSPVSSTVSSQNPIPIEERHFSELSPQEYADRVNQLRSDSMPEMSKIESSGTTEQFTFGDDIKIWITPRKSIVVNSKEEPDKDIIAVFVRACDPELTNGEVDSAIQKAYDNMDEEGKSRFSYIEDMELSISYSKTDNIWSFQIRP